MFKTKHIYITLTLILLSCLFLDILLDNKISYLFCAYIIIFLILSLFLILRGLIYKIDTNLYFGILLLISPIVQLLIYANYTQYFYICLSIFFVLTLSSFCVWKYFKDKSHKNLFFVFLGEFLIFLLPICLTKIKFYILILLSGLWFILNLIVNHLKNKNKG